MSLLFNPGELSEDEFVIEIRFSHQTGLLDRREVSKFLDLVIPHFMLKGFQDKPLFSQISSTNGISGQILPDRISLSSAPDKITLDEFIATSEKFMKSAMNFFGFLYLARAGVRVSNFKKTATLTEAAQCYDHVIKIPTLPEKLGEIAGYSVALQFKEDAYTTNATIATAEKLKIKMNPSGGQVESKIVGILFDIDIFVETNEDMEFKPDVFFPKVLEKYHYTYDQLVNLTGNTK